jgi:hypothetical protein
VERRPSEAMTIWPAAKRTRLSNIGISYDWSLAFLVKTTSECS